MVLPERAEAARNMLAVVVNRTRTPSGVSFAARRAAECNTHRRKRVGTAQGVGVASLLQPCVIERCRHETEDPCIPVALCSRIRLRPRRLPRKSSTKRHRVRHRRHIRLALHRAEHQHSHWWQQPRQSGEWYHTKGYCQHMRALRYRLFRFVQLQCFEPGSAHDSRLCRWKSPRRAAVHYCQVRARGVPRWCEKVDKCVWFPFGWRYLDPNLGRIKAKLRRYMRGVLDVEWQSNLQQCWSSTRVSRSLWSRGRQFYRPMVDGHAKPVLSLPMHDFLGQPRLVRSRGVRRDQKESAHVRMPLRRLPRVSSCPGVVVRRWHSRSRFPNRPRSR